MVFVASYCLARENHDLPSRNGHQRGFSNDLTVGAVKLCHSSPPKKMATARDGLRVKLRFLSFQIAWMKKNKKGGACFKHQTTNQNQNVPQRSTHQISNRLSTGLRLRLRFQERVLWLLLLLVSELNSWNPKKFGTKQNANATAQLFAN